MKRYKTDGDFIIRILPAKPGEDSALRGQNIHWTFLDEPRCYASHHTRCCVCFEPDGELHEKFLPQRKPMFLPLWLADALAQKDV